ncbi:MAG: DUF2285 domain-containing protein [Robiginitomaculum sp.]|nr:DUF2285 domain-containing protein [Robiginitomaculum sp.]
MSNAAWAWEFLRRNTDYRLDFTREYWDGPDIEHLDTGTRLIIGKRRYQRAREWGLLFFADPDRSALETEVFWKPSAFPATLRVKLGDPQMENVHGQRNFDHVADSVILSELSCRRILFDSINQSRHIVLNAPRYWYQLYCDTPHPFDDEAVIRFRIDGAKHSEQRMKTARQLLELHRSAGGKLSQIGTRKNAQKLQEAIIALDVNKADGSYRDIARYLVGNKQTDLEWDSGNCRLKDRARRALAMGKTYRNGDYLTLLG